jgi:hypothetical protein
MTKYVCKVSEILISELLVEAESAEEAEKIAKQVVWDAPHGRYSTDSNTTAEAHEALPEYQEGGEYHDTKEVRVI